MDAAKTTTDRKTEITPFLGTREIIALVALCILMLLAVTAEAPW